MYILMVKKTDILHECENTELCIIVDYILNGLLNVLFLYSA